MSQTPDCWIGRRPCKKARHQWSSTDRKAKFKRLSQLLRSKDLQSELLYPVLEKQATASLAKRTTLKKTIMLINLEEDEGSIMAGGPLINLEEEEEENCD